MKPHELETVRNARREIAAITARPMTGDDTRRVLELGQKIGTIKRAGRPLRLYAAPPDAQEQGSRWYTTPVSGCDTAPYVIAQPHDRMRDLLRGFVARARGTDTGAAKAMIEEAEQLIAETSGFA